MQKFKYNKKSGFVILFAVLASTLILAMAVSIFNVAYKEQVLSGTTKASAYADAAANVGLECALYNDIKKHLFPDPNFSSGFPDGTGAVLSIDEINCVGQEGSAVLIDVDPAGINDFIFTIEIEDGYGIFVDPPQSGATTNVNRPGCVKVYVDKDESLTADGYMTHIVSRGYNVACNKLQTLDDGTINPRIVERRSEVRYNSKGVPGSGGNIPVADIWIDPASGSNVGENTDGGSITISQSDSPYIVQWDSIDTTDCTETVEIVGSPPISAQGFPQSSLADSLTIDPANVEPGDYIYRISCNGLGGSDNDLVRVTIIDGSSGGNPPTANIWVTGNSEDNFDSDGNITLSDVSTSYIIHWDSIDADDGCTMTVSDNDYTNWSSIGTSGQQTVNVASDMADNVFTYTLQCSNSPDSDSDNVFVTVPSNGGGSIGQLDFRVGLDGATWLATSQAYPLGWDIDPLIYPNNTSLLQGSIPANFFRTRIISTNINATIPCTLSGTYNIWAGPNSAVESGLAWWQNSFTLPSSGTTISTISPAGTGVSNTRMDMQVSCTDINGNIVNSSSQFVRLP